METRLDKYRSTKASSNTDTRDSWVLDSPKWG